MIGVKKIIKYCKDNTFLALFAACAALILVLSLIRKCSGEKGTWSKSYQYDKNGINFIPQRYIKQQRAPPTESKGEMECRRVLQHLFRRPFEKARPNFLRNPVTGGNFNLELDCFDPSMGLAVEYNGQQHYKYLPFFHKNKEAFRNQLYRDDMKERMCKDVGVKLINVPYTVKIQDIKGFLENKLRRIGYGV